VAAFPRSQVVFLGLPVMSVLGSCQDDMDAEHSLPGSPDELIRSTHAPKTHLMDRLPMAGLYLGGIGRTNRHRSCRPRHCDTCRHRSGLHERCLRSRRRIAGSVYLVPCCFLFYKAGVSMRSSSSLAKILCRLVNMLVSEHAQHIETLLRGFPLAALCVDGYRQVGNFSFSFERGSMCASGFVVHPNSCRDLPVGSVGIYHQFVTDNPKHSSAE
jgi:hypothetical protein